MKNRARSVLVLGLLGFLGFGSPAVAQEAKHQVAGIGAVVGADGPAEKKAQGSDRIHHAIEIRKVVSDSPADKAGLRAGDRIVEIDGEKVAGLTFRSAVENLLRGSLGSVVKLTVERPGETTPRTFVLVRDVVPLPEQK